MRALAELSRLLSTGDGVVLRREHPELVDVLRREAAQGHVRTVLPGVVVAAGREVDPLVRIQAAARWDPDAIFTGAAAARLSYWPEARLDSIDLAVKYQRRPQRGFRFCRRTVPPELVSERGGLRFTSPALTALDLADLDHTDAIDTALRTRAATIDAMHEALRRTAGRRGNGDRKRVLLDSREEPWSRAERLGHRLLRAAGITGWKANLPFWDLAWLYYIDVAFESAKLAIEIDGRFHEDDPKVFESDRWRQNALVLNGWRVLRFTWEMLRDHPEQFVQAVRRAL